MAFLREKELPPLLPPTSVDLSISDMTLSPTVSDGSSALSPHSVESGEAHEHDLVSRKNSARRKKLHWSRRGSEDTGGQNTDRARSASSPFWGLSRDVSEELSSGKMERGRSHGLFHQTSRGLVRQASHGLGPKRSFSSEEFCLIDRVLSDNLVVEAGIYRAGPVFCWLSSMIVSLKLESAHLQAFVDAMSEAHGEQVMEAFSEWFVTFADVMGSHLDFVDSSLIPFERSTRGQSMFSENPLMNVNVEIMLKLTRVRQMTHQDARKSRKTLIAQCSRLLELANTAFVAQIKLARSLDVFLGGGEKARRAVDDLQLSQLKELRSSALESMSSFSLGPVLERVEHFRSERVSLAWKSAIAKMFSAPSYARRSELVQQVAMFLP